ncbi:class I SAM-dependent methyltransferase [Candidatus Latescibacterota bacterium]
MTDKKRWEDRYINGQTTWDISKHDFNLETVVTYTPIKNCKVLEIGCGTGDNSIWLAQHRFQVTGVDIAEPAIQKAIEKSSASDVSCTFIVRDFMENMVEGAPFDFVFDRGCFHSFDSVEDRSHYTLNVAAHLTGEGLWLTIAGSADDPPRDIGPPRRSAQDIILAVEPHFKILSLYTSHFESNRPIPARAWVCLMRKRDNSFR